MQKIAKRHKESSKAIYQMISELQSIIVKEIENQSSVNRCVCIIDKLLALDSFSDSNPMDDSLQRLTARERQVAKNIAAGLTNAEIAEILTVSVNTVRFHVRGILSKVGATNRSEVAAMVGWQPR